MNHVQFSAAWLHRCLIAAGCLIAGASAAVADLTPIGDSAIPGEPHLTEPDNAGDGTDGILDFLYGLSNLQRVDDGGDQLWQITSPAASARAVAKFSRAVTSFGVMPDIVAPYEELFPVESEFTFPIIDPLDGYDITTGGPANFPASVASDPFALGFQITPSAGPTVFFSSLASANPVGQDLMVTFEIIGNTGHPSNPIGSYIVGWEDDPSFDLDYQDAVIEITGAAPIIPEPATALIFTAIAAAALTARRRTKRRR